jgi:glycosyltransferase involved in cell wall biosynthesis
MNIWILNHYADTPDRQATRTYDLSKQLVERGHQVTIFAAGFSHYSFREERIRSGETWREEDWNGVRFLWLKTPPYRKNDRRRVANMVTFAWRAFWLGLKRKDKPDAIIGVSVHPLAALSAWALSVAKRSRFFFEVTDLWPEVLVDFGMLPRRHPATWLLRAMEKFLYRRAERIIMIWPRTEEYVARFGIAPEKIVWIPHLADLSRYEELEPYDGTIRERFTVMYLGSFVNFMAIEVILEAAKLLEDRGRRNIRFVLVGGGTERERLARLAVDLRLQNVEFPGLVAKKDIARTMGGADAFVVTLKNVPLLRYGISLNKACDYLASGRPTILAGEPGYDPIREAGAGISVAAENPSALADAVEALKALPPEERVQMGRNGREYLERVHGMQVLADRLEKVLIGCGPGETIRSKAAAPAKESEVHSL